MKTFQQFLEDFNPGIDARASYDGPAHGQLMSKLSVDNHLACMNHHTSQINSIKAGTHKDSGSTWHKDPHEKARIINDHSKRYYAHKDAIEKLGDVGNHHKD